MMMGTADEVVKAPEKGPVFMEDLPEEEQVVSLVSGNLTPCFYYHFSCSSFSLLNEKYVPAL